MRKIAEGKSGHEIVDPWRGANLRQKFVADELRRAERHGLCADIMADVAFAARRIKPLLHRAMTAIPAFETEPAALLRFTL